MTKHVGLSRSTVAALVGELAALGLVEELESKGTSQVGRPSPTVRILGRTVSLVVNPEIDSITIGVVALGGTVVKKIRYETLHVPTAREAVNIAAAVIEGMQGELDSSYHVVGVGVAVPGLIRTRDSLVRLAPHLGWVDEPIGDLLQDAVGYPVFADNDAKVGAVAESIFGCGTGVPNMVYLNGGASGIGGGVIVEGELMHGAGGYAGEFGHMLVNSDGLICHCGASGCLETEVSQRELADALGLASVDIDTLENALSQSNSPTVDAVVGKQIRHLGNALGNAVNIFNPELIVLGGFLGILHDIAGAELAEVARRRQLSASGELVRTERATLSSNTLLVGAAELAFAGLLADPAAPIATRR